MISGLPYTGFLLLLLFACVFVFFIELIIVSLESTKKIIIRKIGIYVTLHTRRILRGWLLELLF